MKQIPELSVHVVRNVLYVRALMAGKCSTVGKISGERLIFWRNVLQKIAPADNGRTKQEQPVNKKNTQSVPNFTFHLLDVNKSRTERARNVNNARTVFALAQESAPALAFDSIVIARRL
jgi:hypothetical protein